MARFPFFFSGRGFTLPELVLVIVIVAVLSVVAFSRLSGSFAGTRGYYDGATALIQYARKLAIAQRRAVYVQVAAGSVTLCYAAAAPCASPVPSPPVSPASANPLSVSFSTSPSLSVTAPSGVSSAPVVTFQFSALGAYLDNAGAEPGANLAITVSGEGSHTLTVHRVTGYVQQ